MGQIIAQKGYQEKMVRSNVDVVFGGGGVAVGKTFAAILAISQYIHLAELQGFIFSGVH